MNPHAKNTDIPVWDKGGGLYIHPHMKIVGHTHNLRAIAQKLQEKLQSETIKIFVLPQSSYAAEINGPWNVVLSISFLKENNASDTDGDTDGNADAAKNSPERVTGMYMIRRCIYYEETYFCPFFKTTRRPEVHLGLYPIIMDRITDAIKDLYPEAIKISGFPTHDLKSKCSSEDNVKDKLNIDNQISYINTDKKFKYNHSK